MASLNNNSYIGNDMDISGIDLLQTKKLIIIFVNYVGLSAIVLRSQQKNLQQKIKNILDIWKKKLCDHLLSMSEILTLNIWHGLFFQLQYDIL